MNTKITNAKNKNAENMDAKNKNVENTKKISDALGNIDTKYVEEAIAYEHRASGTRATRAAKWLIPIAACLILCALCIPIYRRIMRGQHQCIDEPQVNKVLIGGIIRTYRNDTHVIPNESSIIFPWEYLTAAERYVSAIYNGVKYDRFEKVSETYLGDVIGSCEVSGYDIYTDATYTQNCTVRAIQGISPQLRIAVELDGEYYAFSDTEYNPPAAFGDILNLYNLADNLPLEYFTEYDAEYDGNEETLSGNAYRLENDDAVWELLSACGDAPFIENDTEHRRFNKIRSIVFRTTSDALGISNRAFEIYEDGYITTNIFEYKYTFNIGAENALAIMSYATANAQPTKPQPYSHTLCGTLTEIGDGYIIVDDSVLCVNPSDGMEFKISSDDIRIKRGLEFEHIGAGDVVAIEYKGEARFDDGHLVIDVVSFNRGELSEYGVIIPE